MAKTKRHSIFIRGKRWRYGLLEDDKFFKLHGEDSIAIVNKDSGTVDFRLDGVSLKTCRHELWHLYKASLYTGSAHLTHGDMEELEAEMMEDYMHMMPGQAEQMYLKLKGDLDEV